MSASPISHLLASISLAASATARNVISGFIALAPGCFAGLHPRVRRNVALAFLKAFSCCDVTKSAPHERLDPAAQAAQRQRGKAPGQLAAGGEIAARRVEPDADLEPPVMHRRFLSGRWVACGPRATSRSATR